MSERTVCEVKWLASDPADPAGECVPGRLKSRKVTDDAARQGGGREVAASWRIDRRRPAEHGRPGHVEAAGAARRHHWRHVRWANDRRRAGQRPSDLTVCEDDKTCRQIGCARRTHCYSPYVHTDVFLYSLYNLK